MKNALRILLFSYIFQFTLLSSAQGANSTFIDPYTAAHGSENLGAYDLWRVGGVTMLLAPMGNAFYQMILKKIEGLTYRDVVKFGSDIYGKTCGRKRPNPLTDFFSEEEYILPRPEKDDIDYQKNLILFNRSRKNYMTFIGLGKLLHRLVKIKHGTEIKPEPDVPFGIFQYIFARSSDSVTTFEIGAFTEIINSLLSSDSSVPEDVITLKNWKKTITSFFETGHLLSKEDPRFIGLISSLSEMIATGFIKGKIIPSSDKSRPDDKELFLTFCFNPIDFDQKTKYEIIPSLVNAYLRISISLPSVSLDTAQIAATASVLRSNMPHKNVTFRKSDEIIDTTIISINDGLDQSNEQINTKPHHPITSSEIQANVESAPKSPVYTARAVSYVTPKVKDAILNAKASANYGLPHSATVPSVPLNYNNDEFANINMNTVKASSLGRASSSTYSRKTILEDSSFNLPKKINSELKSHEEQSNETSTNLAPLTLDKVRLNGGPISLTNLDDEK